MFTIPLSDDLSSSSHSLSPEASVEASVEVDGGCCVLSHNPLNVRQIIDSVGDGAAGAATVFIGTTRNSFGGRTVTRLEYQAYSKLAIKTMVEIVKAARQMVTRSEHHPSNTAVPSLVRCAVHHRLGTVPVGEPSIVIAVSSPHRKEAFLACEFILEEVKRRAQIWKREFYESGTEDDTVWKFNS